VNPEVETFPSGLKFVRILDHHGRISQESYSYGSLDIGICYMFESGVKYGELYYLKRKSISRKRYEIERLKFPDLPRANVEADFLAGLRKDISQEARRKSRQSAGHVPDVARAREIDGFCRALCAKPRAADALLWSNEPGHALGVMSARGTRAFLKRLREAGCQSLTVCDVQSDGLGLESSSDLVAELPADIEGRKRVFRIAARRAREEGFDPYLDDGQQFIYFKLA
jgi:hypothetical protein